MNEVSTTSAPLPKRFAICSLTDRAVSPAATFSYLLAFMRRGLWAAKYFVDSASTPQSDQFDPDVVNQLPGLLSEPI
jgi:hypothetical protein